MQTDKMVLAVEEDGPVCECTVDEFVSSNESGMAAEDLADIAHLAIGQKLQFGGGAAPVFTVSRVS